MVARWICYRPWGLLGHSTPWQPVRQEAEASLLRGMADNQQQLLVGWTGRTGPPMNPQRCRVTLSLVRDGRAGEGCPLGLPGGHHPPSG